MSMASEMAVTLRLPTSTLFHGEVVRMTAVSPSGAFGVLPNHADLVTAIVPSVLTLTLVDGSEEIFGLDEGLLVKKAHDVSIVVRRGVHGDDLENLQKTVDESFVQMDEEERQARSALSRLEADMVRRMAELRKPQR